LPEIDKRDEPSNMLLDLSILSKIFPDQLPCSIDIVSEKIVLFLQEADIFPVSVLLQSGHRHFFHSGWQ